VQRGNYTGSNAIELKLASDISVSHFYVCRDVDAGTGFGRHVDKVSGINEREKGGFGKWMTRE
jgi:hypothetical protein